MSKLHQIDALINNYLHSLSGGKYGKQDEAKGTSTPKTPPSSKADDKSSEV